MRFVVFAAGAVGGVVGARLHQAGHDVALIARGVPVNAALCQLAAQQARPRTGPGKLSVDDVLAVAA